MNLDLDKEVTVMRRMTVKELMRKYLDAFGEPSRSHNKDYLVRRIAWRLQALAEGDLSQRTRRRAEELANDADLRMQAPRIPPSGASERTVTAKPCFTGDNRLPVPGTILTRTYKGQTYQVNVLPNGFDFKGQVYRSLSVIAKVITGTHWNGFHFFGLGKKGNSK